MLTIYPLTLWSQNVLTKNFWSKMNFSNRIINSFQTSWNKLAKLSIRKLTLTSQTLYIQFHDAGNYELLPISQKPLKISNWNFTCILQRHIGIRKYQNRPGTSLRPKISWLVTYYNRFTCCTENTQNSNDPDQLASWIFSSQLSGYTLLNKQDIFKKKDHARSDLLLNKR